MAKSLSHFPAVMLLVGIMAGALFHIAEAQSGVCYGTVGNNLPPASEAIALYHKYNIKRMRLFDTNPAILQALRGSHIEVMVGVTHDVLPDIAGNPSAAKSWVQYNILKYSNNVKIRYIGVGNEISPLDNSSSRLAPFVVPAMHNIQDAINSAGLGRRIKVSTALSTGVLANTYPPSAGAFWPQIRASFIDPIIEFLLENHSPLLVNVYPYFSYANNPSGISLDYAIFKSPSVVVVDGQYKYQNLFDANLDASYAALEKAGGENVEIVVSETGWPSFGGTGTTTENARSYNGNLLKHVKGGSPRRPGKAIEAYIFELFDENMKSPEVEKNWGLFYPNKQPKYNFTFH